MSRCFFFLLVVLFITSAGCAAHPAPAAGSGQRLAPGSPLALASFTENGVTVHISIEQDADGQIFLAATFTPIDSGFHLYNKNLPRNGINGLGRPTLLELAPASQMQAAGELTVSLPAGQAEGLEEMMTYPEGPVTLRLAVVLPGGDDWVEDQVSVTFMACSVNACRPPVVGKIVAVRVPGTGMLANP